jgi:endonuclease/exonuclease/phosphatase family metal-dependent hydrolase
VDQRTVLKVLAYNLYFGGTDRLAAIQSVLAHCNADVICLTEADDRTVVETLAAHLNFQHVWARGSGDRHIATLSRYPIVGWNIYNTRPLTQAVLETKIAIDSAPPVQRESEPEGVGSKTLTLYNTHLLPYLLLPFEIRRWQAVGKLLDIIRQRQPGPHLILGDLNAIAPNDRVLQSRNPPRMKRTMLLQFRLIFRLALPRLLSAGYVDCFRTLHPNADGFTWMPGNPTTRYDYILADTTLAPAIQSCRVVDDHPAVQIASDHFPLLATFKL